MRVLPIEELKTMLAQGAKLVDAREEDEFYQVHIPGAINLPLSQIHDHLDKLDPNNHYYLICKAGGRAMKAAQVLDQAGYQVSPVSGGMAEWTGALQRKQ